MVPRPAHQALDSLQKSGGWLLTLAKWAIYGILILAGLYWLWRSRASLLAGLQGFLAGLRQLRQNLLGGRRERAEEAAAASGPQRPRLPSFADFADPFAAGTAGRCSADELIRYSFEALEAWARERGCARGPEQTPHEFSRNVGVCAASLSREARVLADLYCQAAYAPGTVAAARVDCLERFWRQLRCETTVAGAKAGG
ncbi:MAG: hypothetical protein A2V70_11000 [Planctomycetes bacterium RBG_13_63_9]|nr:MAG: hypothetical protein A2V70_11000 [Planctomycetes bacterium RBG_13_63_9]